MDRNKRKSRTLHYPFIVALNVNVYLEFVPNRSHAKFRNYGDGVAFIFALM